MYLIVFHGIIISCNSSNSSIDFRFRSAWYLILIPPYSDCFVSWISGVQSIFSPGIGTQGGNANEVILAGTNYLIVGRTILNSKNPINVAKELHLQSIGK